MSKSRCSLVMKEKNMSSRLKNKDGLHFCNFFSGHGHGGGHGRQKLETDNEVGGRRGTSSFANNGCPPPPPHLHWQCIVHAHGHAERSAARHGLVEGTATRSLSFFLFLSIDDIYRNRRRTRQTWVNSAQSTTGSMKSGFSCDCNNTSTAYRNVDVLTSIIAIARKTRFHCLDPGVVGAEFTTPTATPTATTGHGPGAEFSRDYGNSVFFCKSF